jgi:hypothetical protein
MAVTLKWRRVGFVVLTIVDILGLDMEEEDIRLRG